MQLPLDFITIMHQCLGQDQAEDLFRSLDLPSPISIRLNPLKQTQPHWPLATPVPWCSNGYYLPQRPQFTLDPLLHAGCYYVQEASSQFTHFALQHILNLLIQQSDSSAPQQNPQSLLALDLCAAPGGKSTLALSLLPTQSLLIANEVNPARALVLKDNIQRWGAPNVRVTQESPSAFTPLRHCFDLIIADLPCSGEGMFRKEPIALQQWSPHYIQEMATLQRNIINDVWPSLRPGGYLIYSTCTYNPLEDEQNVQQLLADLPAESIPLFPSTDWHILPAYQTALLPHLPVPHAYHLLPSLLQGEGFFLSVLRKPEASISNLRRKQPWLKLHTIYDPSQNPISNYPHIELDLNQARRYLRGESLNFSPDTPRGLIQVCYQSHPLGLMKNIGSRANNLYPKNLRIRTTYID